MVAYIALLRRGECRRHGQAAIDRFESDARRADFCRLRTYIATATWCFNPRKNEAQVKAALEAALSAYAGKPVGVMVRTAPEMAQCWRAIRFRRGQGIAPWPFFLDVKPSAECRARDRDEPGQRTALTGCTRNYGYYPDGQGNSKLKLPAAKMGRRGT